MGSYEVVLDSQHSSTQFSIKYTPRVLIKFPNLISDPFLFFTSPMLLCISQSSLNIQPCLLSAWRNQSDIWKAFWLTHTPIENLWMFSEIFQRTQFFPWSLVIGFACLYSFLSYWVQSSLLLEKVHVNQEIHSINTACHGHHRGMSCSYANISTAEIFLLTAHLAQIAVLTCTHQTLPTEAIFAHASTPLYSHNPTHTY